VAGKDNRRKKRGLEQKPIPKSSARSTARKTKKWRGVSINLTKSQWSVRARAIAVLVTKNPEDNKAQEAVASQRD